MLKTTIFIVVASIMSQSSPARSDDAVSETRSVDRLGIDVVTIVAPERLHDGTAVGGGPMFRLDLKTSTVPSWLGFGVRWGVLTTSNDRIYAPVLVGLVAQGANDGPFASAQVGALFLRELYMDDDRFAIYGSVSAGYRLGNWNLRAEVVGSPLLDFGHAYIFSFGRDFARVDGSSTTHRL